MLIFVSAGDGPEIVVGAARREGGAMSAFIGSSFIVDDNELEELMLRGGGAIRAARGS